MSIYFNSKNSISLFLYSSGFNPTLWVILSSKSTNMIVKTHPIIQIVPTELVYLSKKDANKEIRDLDKLSIRL